MGNQNFFKVQRYEKTVLKRAAWSGNQAAVRICNTVVLLIQRSDAGSQTECNIHDASFNSRRTFNGVRIFVSDFHLSFFVAVDSYIASMRKDHRRGWTRWKDVRRWRTLLFWFDNVTINLDRLWYLSKICSKLPTEFGRNRDSTSRLPLPLFIRRCAVPFARALRGWNFFSSSLSFPSCVLRLSRFYVRIANSVYLCVTSARCGGCAHRKNSEIGRGEAA